MGGNCESIDGSAIGAGNAEACWRKGGVVWTPYAGTAVNNPNLPAAIVAHDPKSPEAAKAVSDAKAAQSTAEVATAAAGKAEQTAVVAEQNAVAAKAAAEDAKLVRDKCIKAANEAHKKAMESCGPELGAKEGFGYSEGPAGVCGMWLLMLVVLLVFVAVCMQGAGSSSDNGLFQIDSALV